MPHHVDIIDLERRKARLEEELEHLQQQLQRLRILRAQIVLQQRNLVRQNGSKQQYDELQQQYQGLLKLFVATIEERAKIIDLLSQFERYNEDRFPTMEMYYNALHAASIEQQEHWPFLRLPDTSRPSLAEQDMESTHTDHSIPTPAKQRGLFSRGRIKVSPLFLALLLSLVPGLCFLLYAVHSLPYGPSTIAAPRSVLTPTSPSSAAKAATLYPPVAQSYAGVINDIGVGNTKTNMYLTQLKQDQNRISGSFQGLGLIGSFTGTVTSYGKVHFTVKIDAGMLIFDGNIKVGGDIRGTFKAVDQQGQSSGEYGDWNVGVVPGEN